MKELARNPKQMGNLIRTARKRKKFSQKALAGRVGLRQENISMIENGYASTKLHVILSAWAALDLELAGGAPRSRGRWSIEG